MPLHEPLGHPVEPESPPPLAFRDPDSRDHVGHPCPTGGDPADEIGMEEHRLQHVRILLPQEPPQLPRDAKKVRRPSGPKAVDLDPSRFQGRHQGPRACGRWRGKPIDDR